MALDPAELPDDLVTLKAMLIAADRHARDLDAEIETLKLTIAKLQHERFGPSSERARLLDQLELQLGELVEHVAQAATAAEIAAAQPSQPDGGQAARSMAPRRRPARRPLPDNLPRAPRRALAHGVPVLRRPVAQPRIKSGGGYHRDAGARAGAVEGDPDRAREVHVPHL